MSLLSTAGFASTAWLELKSVVADDIECGAECCPGSRLMHAAFFGPAPVAGQKRM